MGISLRMWLQIAMGAVGYLVWAFMAYDDPSLRPDFLKLNVLVVTVIVSHVLRDMGISDTTPPIVLPPIAPPTPAAQTEAQPTDKATS